ncbi:isochorismatase family protein, partial [Bacillus paranthracis]
MMEYKQRELRDMKKALLVIDVQAGMYTAKMPVHNGEKFLQTLQELIEKCRSNDIPVIYVQHNGRKDHPLEKGTVNWTRKVRHIFKQLIRIEFCILQEAILLILP